VNNNIFITVLVVLGIIAVIVWLIQARWVPGQSGS